MGRLSESAEAALLDARDDRIGVYEDAMFEVLDDALVRISAAAEKKWRSKTGLVAAGSPSGTGDGAMACLWFGRINGDLPVADGLDEDELHITAFYLGDAGDFDEDQRAEIVDIVAGANDEPFEHYDTIPAHTIATSEVAFFGRDQVAVVLKVPERDGGTGNDATWQLARQVRAALEDAGYESPSDFDFDAHITVAYYDDREAAEAAGWSEGDEYEVELDVEYLGVWFAGDKQVSEHLGDSSMIAAGALVAAGEDAAPSIDPDDMWDEVVWADAMEDAGDVFALAAVGEGAEFGLSWLVTAPNVVEVAAAHIEQLAGLETAARSHLQATVAEALTDGMSIDKAAKKLTETGPFSGTGARFYAQTEIVSATNVASKLAADLTFEEGDEKAWLSTPDDRTRPTHVVAGSMAPIPWNQDFEVGGEFCPVPGHSNLSMKERGNCRCSWYRVRAANKNSSGGAMGFSGFKDVEVSLVPTAAMAKEAGRGLKWVEAGEHDPGGVLSGLAQRIADREELGENDLVLIENTVENAAAGIMEDGGRPNEDGYPNRWRVESACAGGEDGRVWSRRKQRQLDRLANEGASMTITDTDTDKADSVSGHLSPEHQAKLADALVTAYLEGNLAVDDLAAAFAFQQAGPDENVLWSDDLESFFARIEKEAGSESIVPSAGETIEDGAVGVTASAGYPVIFTRRGAGNNYDALVAAGPNFEFMDEDGNPVAYEFHMLMTLEGVKTDDGRRIELGALTWRMPPLPLLFQMEQTWGHDQAKFAGSIREVVRDASEIWGAGMFDTGEYGQEAMRMIDEGTVTGVSVDLTAVEVDYLWKEVTEEVEGGEDFVWYQIELLLITAAKIAATTIVSIPAFEDAYIELIDADEQTGAGSLMASGGPGAAWSNEDLSRYYNDSLVASGGMPPKMPKFNATLFVPFEFNATGGTE